MTASQTCKACKYEMSSWVEVGPMSIDWTDSFFKHQAMESWASEKPWRSAIPEISRLIRCWWRCFWLQPSSAEIERSLAQLWNINKTVTINSYHFAFWSESVLQIITIIEFQLQCMTEHNFLSMLCYSKTLQSISSTSVIFTAISVPNILSCFLWKLNNHHKTICSN